MQRTWSYQSLFVYNCLQLNCLKNNFKIYIKIDIETAPTCFGVITIIRERTINAHLDDGDYQPQLKEYQQTNLLIEYQWLPTVIERVPTNQFVNWVSKISESSDDRKQVMVSYISSWYPTTYLWW